MDCKDILKLLNNAVINMLTFDELKKAKSSYLNNQFNSAFVSLVYAYSLGNHPTLFTNNPKR